MADITTTNVDLLQTSSVKTALSLQPAHLAQVPEELNDKSDTDSKASGESIFSNYSEASSVDDAPQDPPVLTPAMAYAVHVAARAILVQQISDSQDILEASMAELEHVLIAEKIARQQQREKERMMFVAFAAVTFFGGVLVGSFGGYVIWGRR